jgi:hypothetical protein
MGSETVQNVDDVIAIIKCVTDSRCFFHSEVRIIMIPFATIVFKPTSVFTGYSR